MFNKILRKIFTYQKSCSLKNGMQRECYSQFSEDVAINSFLNAFLGIINSEEVEIKVKSGGNLWISRL